MITSATKVIRRLWYFIAILIIFAAALVSVSRLMTPYLNEHLPDFEKWASESLQNPVTIHHVHIAWRGYEPEIAFDEVKILDKVDQNTLLQIHQVKVNLSIFKSLMKWQLFPENIIITGVALKLHQDAAGHITVEGFSNRTTGPAKMNELLRWIFQEAQFTLQNIDVTFFPHEGIEKQIRIANINLQNDGSQHSLGADAVLQQENPTRIRTRIRWSGDFTDLSRVSANVYLNLDDVSLTQWFNHFAWHGVQLNQGFASGKVWASWENNQWQSVQSRFQFFDLALQSQSTHRTQNISNFTGHIGWQRKADKIVVAGEEFVIDFPHHSWPLGTFYLTLIPDKELTLQAIQFGNLNLKNLKNLALLGDFLEQDWQKEIIALNPAGTISQLNATFIKPFNFSEPSGLAFENVAFSANLANVSFNTWKSFPGIKNLTASVNWDGAKGDIATDSEKISIFIPTVFANALDLQKLSADIKIIKDSNAIWSVSTENAKVINADITAAAKLKLIFPPKQSMQMDVTGDFTVMQAENIYKYLPLKIFSSDLSSWLKRAFKGGSVASGKAVLKGNAQDFPYKHGNGDFVISGKVRNLNFEYAPHWPLIQNVNGELIFSRNAMIANVETGQILNTTLGPVQGEIPELDNDATSWLKINGTINTDLTKGLEFIHASPLENIIGKKLGKMRLTGPMQLKLSLNIPLAKPENAKVLGDVTTQDAQLQLPAWDLTLQRLSGNFQFTEQGIEGKNLQGQLWSQPLTLNLTTQQGNWVPRTSRGTTDKKTSLVTANLMGKLAISDLQQWLHVQVPDIIQGTVTDYKTEIQFPADNAPTQVQVNSNLVGIRINLPAPLGKKSEESRATQLTMFIKEGEPLRLKLNYNELLTAGLSLDKNTNNYTVTLNNPQMDGQLVFPNTWPIKLVQARFHRLNLLSNFASGQKVSMNPRLLPAISFVGDDVRYDGNSIGHVEFETASDDGMLIKKLTVDSAAGELTASGEWQSMNGANVSFMRGNLESSNVGQLLKNWGFDSSNFNVNEGSATFDLSWDGAPYQFSAADLSGKFSITLGKGNIVDIGSSGAQMGLGRLLSIFSLNTLPRRLSLDFSDVFQKGYSFDSMKGNFDLRDGNAFTQDMRFEGPVARIDLAGRIGFALKDLDMRISVTPYISPSIPAVAALVYPPLALAGLATWVAGKVITRPAGPVSTYQYSVTGSWSNPIWDKSQSPPPR